MMSRLQQFFDDIYWIVCVNFENVMNFFRCIGWYFSNIHRFRKDLWGYRTWDSEYCTRVFATSLEGLRDCLIDGHEVEISRNKKVKSIQELINLLRNDPENDDELYHKYIKHEFDYERELTDKEHKILSKELHAYEEALKKAEDNRLKRIFQIIKGQSTKELDTTKEIEKLEREDPERAKQESYNGYYNLYEEKFDGTGYKTWWD